MDRQWRVLMEGYILQWTDSGGVLMEGYILQWIDGQMTMDGIDGGLRPAN